MSWQDTEEARRQRAEGMRRLQQIERDGPDAYVRQMAVEHNLPLPADMLEGNRKQRRTAASKARRGK